MIPRNQVNEQSVTEMKQLIQEINENVHYTSGEVKNEELITTSAIQEILQNFQKINEKQRKTMPVSSKFSDCTYEDSINIAE